jgi:cytochrome c
MDKMTVNMIAGAVLSALLVIVGMNTFVEIIYPRGAGPETADHGKTGEASVAGHSADAAKPAAEEAPASQPLPVLLANASAEAGAAQIKKCTACHGFEQGGANKVGPNLHGIVGNPVASHEGFAYSEALKQFGGVWDYERLDCFLKNPKACVAGTKMAFAGIKKDGERADVIAYLRSVSPNAPPLPIAQGAGAGGDQKPVEASASPARGAAAPAQN